MADLAGGLNIGLRRRDGGLAVDIRSSRPVAASRVFVGRSVGETAGGLPALFSICATAQACACVSAIEAALGLTAAPSVTRMRRLLVDAETVKEHLWRMLLDWPAFLDRPPGAKAMSAAMAAYNGLRTALRASELLQIGAPPAAPDISALAARLDDLVRLSAEQILGALPSVWLEGVGTGQALIAWSGSGQTPAAELVQEVQALGWASVGRNQVTALPDLRAPDLEPALGGAGADRFVAEPTWEGSPRESSPFTRQRERGPVAALIGELGNGLLPRLTAQLVELARLLRSLRAGQDALDAPAEPLAESTAAGVGIALVPAARGLLVHRVELDRDRVRDYRILAPTEWNFHPSGVVARGLSALPDPGSADLERQAGLYVTAVDPCVEYHVTLS
jgi:hypothetical protein